MILELQHLKGFAPRSSPCPIAGQEFLHKQADQFLNGPGSQVALGRLPNRSERFLFGAFTRWKEQLSGV